MSLPYSGPERAARRRLFQGLALALLVACDEKHPIAPSSPIPEQPSAAPPPAPGLSTMFSERARVFDPRTARLVSTSEEQARGRYRYRADSAPLPVIRRDDFIVGNSDTAFVRLVLSAERVGDELVIETGHAYWHEVIKGGTHGITMPFDNSEATSFDGQVARLILPDVSVSSSPVSLGELEIPFDKTDICAWGDSLLGEKLCGKEHDKELGWLTIEGKIDTLVIHSGSVKATGTMDIGMTVSPGGITGGSPPVFAPCNRANYLGCIATPTGAALIEWLRTYVPQIPEGSLPAVRLCIPGLPVRVKAGYWDYSGFLPRWVPPVFERCRVTSVGVLPTVVPPSFTDAAANVRPHVVGSMIIQVKGDGTVGLEIPIPSLGIKKAYTIGNDFKAQAQLGLFVGLELQVKNAGGTFLVTFDQAGVAAQAWTASNGWDGGWTSTTNEKSVQVLAIDRPDSMIVRVSLPVAAEAELCIAIISCDVEEPKLRATGDRASGLFDVGIEVKAGIKAYPLVDAIYTREVISETPFVDNAKLALEGAWGLELKAGLKIPLTGWILPSVPREWEKELEWGRVPLGDLWFQGKLDVRTTTTGSAPDADGYDIRVERADTLPRIIRAGADRLGPAFDHGKPMTAHLDAGDTVIFAKSVPCAVWYSDYLLFTSGAIFGGVVQGLRAVGVDIPNYAITYPCDLLVARYQLTLSGISENCSVAGGPVRELWLQSKDILLGRSDTAVTTFEVTCNGADPLGSLEVRIDGGGTGPGDYVLALDGIELGRVGRGATAVFTNLRAGVARSLTATGGPSNCVALDPVSVTLTAATTTVVTLGGPCFLFDEPPPPPGTVTVISATTGDGTDEDGYQVLLDGAQRAGVGLNGAVNISGVPAATPSVLHVTNIAGHCRPVVPLPLPFALDASATPIELNVGIACTAIPADTVLGVVESASGMISLRLASGALLGITGPLRTDFAQLAGVQVRAWGTKTGTSLDANGYQVSSTLADPRVSGIVVVRGAETWLFGDEAIRVLDAPAALRGAAGSFVWIGGPRTGSDVTPRIFGIIRSAP